MIAVLQREGFTLVSRAFINAVITIVSELPNWEAELTSTALMHCESVVYEPEGMIILNEYNLESLKATLLKLKQRQRAKYDSLLQHWPGMEAGLAFNWEGKFQV